MPRSFQRNESHPLSKLERRSCLEDRHRIHLACYLSVTSSMCSIAHRPTRFESSRYPSVPPLYVCLDEEVEKKKKRKQISCLRITFLFCFLSFPFVHLYPLDVHAKLIIIFKYYFLSSDDHLVEISFFLSFIRNKIHVGVIENNSSEKSRSRNDFVFVSCHLKVFLLAVRDFFRSLERDSFFLNFLYPRSTHENLSSRRTSAD